MRVSLCFVLVMHCKSGYYLDVIVVGPVAHVFDSIVRSGLVTIGAHPGSGICCAFSLGLIYRLIWGVSLMTPEKDPVVGVDLRKWLSARKSDRFPSEFRAGFRGQIRNLDPDRRSWPLFQKFQAETEIYTRS